MHIMRRIRRTVFFLTCGAVLAYLLDPTEGAERRRRAGDVARSASRWLRETTAEVPPAPDPGGTTVVSHRAPGEETATDLDVATAGGPTVLRSL